MLGTAQRTSYAAAPPTDRSGFRPDVQALRALAVALVIGFHLWPDAVPGGFVGVDVFFVISGYLITSHLARELVATGQIRVAAFWCRRARRLLPASLLVLLVTIVAAMRWAPLSARAGFLREMLASACYVQNWALSAKAVDYLHANDAPSPVQHYWSLSVEEQFYLVLPLLMLVCAAMARRRRLLGGVRGLLVVLTVASLLYGVALTAQQPGAAYFSTWGRAWEFLLGGVWAVLAVVLPRRLALPLGLAGLGAVILAAFAFSSRTAFPGYAAALPVVGAVALLAAAHHSPLALAARLRPVTWLGDVSYAAYLWHWPMVVLVPDAARHLLTPVQKLLVVAATLALAGLSTRFLEAPLRRSNGLLGGRRAVLRTAVATAVAMSFVGGAALAAAASADHDIASLQAQSAELLARTPVRCLGAAGALAGRSGHSPACPDLTGVLVPDPSVAGLDDDNPLSCWASTDPHPHICHWGSDDPRAFRVVALGDSHNNMYMPWFRHLAASRGWSVYVAGHAGCTWGTRPQDNHGTATSAACTEWKRNIASFLAGQPPFDLVLTTAMQADGPVRTGAGESELEAGVASARQAWRSQITRGSVVVALRDTPRPRSDVVSCVDLRDSAVNQHCGRLRRTAYVGPDALSSAVRETPGSALIDPRDLVCPGVRCAAVMDHVVVYRDDSHLTRTFVRTMIPALDARLDAAMDDAQHRSPSATSRGRP